MLEALFELATLRVPMLATRFGERPGVTTRKAPAARWSGTYTPANLTDRKHAWRISESPSSISVRTRAGWW
jgi:hypothetical protein